MLSPVQPDEAHASNPPHMGTRGRVLPHNRWQARNVHKWKDDRKEMMS
jgi:hypothetical protein